MFFAEQSQQLFCNQSSHNETQIRHRITLNIQTVLYLVQLDAGFLLLAESKGGSLGFFSLHIIHFNAFTCNFLIFCQERKTFEKGSC